MTENETPVVVITHINDVGTVTTTVHETVVGFFVALRHHWYTTKNVMDDMLDPHSSYDRTELKLRQAEVDKLLDERLPLRLLTNNLDSLPTLLAEVELAINQVSAFFELEMDRLDPASKTESIIETAPERLILALAPLRM